MLRRLILRSSRDAAGSPVLTGSIARRGQLLVRRGAWRPRCTRADALPRCTSLAAGPEKDFSGSFLPVGWPRWRLTCSTPGFPPHFF